VRQTPRGFASLRVAPADLRSEDGLAVPSRLGTAVGHREQACVVHLFYYEGHPNLALGVLRARTLHGAPGSHGMTRHSMRLGWPTFDANESSSNDDARRVAGATLALAWQIE